MGNKVRLASIGTGMIGQVHARALAKLNCCEYLAIADMDSSRKDFAESLGARYYSDFKEMISTEKLDGVVISVPNEMHAELGSYCAEQGLHIFMEKPIASSVEDAERLIESTRKNGVQLLIGHHRRFNPLINSVKEIIAAGELGNILGINMLWAMYKPSDYFQNSGEWRRRKGGGPILINIIHEIDNLRYMYGEIERVYAEINNKARKFEVEDTIGVTLRMKDGTIASILLSDSVPSKWAYEQTMGENDFFYQGKGNIYHFLGDQGSLAFPEMLKISYEDKSRAGWQYPLKLERLNLRSADPYPAQMEHFCRVVRGEETPRTSGEDALRSLKVTMAVMDSGVNHRPVEV
ncbi:Gfo/Idh/MocA family oxidoreductase [Marispirochaeta aestuarii]|uniref:Gfo/Idh/MocA family protein n=1 Tax=Marispirochaeta aestuarii TaxID=1963862 RepID=UPI0029C8FBEB|nr:Gfo/Idh/MocA family oxidoreductase [Marispirochaeta aestuarii]